MISSLKPISKELYYRLNVQPSALLSHLAGWFEFHHLVSALMQSPLRNAALTQ